MKLSEALRLDLGDLLKELWTETERATMRALVAGPFARQAANLAGEVAAELSTVDAQCQRLAEQLAEAEKAAADASHAAAVAHAAFIVAQEERRSGPIDETMIEHMAKREASTDARGLVNLAQNRLRDAEGRRKRLRDMATMLATVEAPDPAELAGIPTVGNGRI